MTSASQLDQIIDDVTVDCYSEDEAASAFAAAVDECLDGGSIPARLAGFDTRLVGVDYRSDRRGVVASIRHDGRPFKVALYDVEIDAEVAPALAKLLAAYRRWCNQ